MRSSESWKLEELLPGQCTAEALSRYPLMRLRCDRATPFATINAASRHVRISKSSSLARCLLNAVVSAGLASLASELVDAMPAISAYVPHDFL